MQRLPTYRLTSDIKTQLHNLITTGTPVKTAATRLGCNYLHALNFAHNTGLLPRPGLSERHQAFLELVRSGVAISTAAKAHDM